MLTVDNNTFFSTVEDYIRKGTPVTLQVKGNSMLPFLRNERDQVEFHPYKDNEVHRGAIVLFRYKGAFVMHRIIQRSGNDLFIQGDGICQNHEQVSVSDVIAIVKNITRFSRNGKKDSISCQSLRWRIYSQCWMLLTPLRRYLLAIYRKTAK